MLKIEHLTKAFGDKLAVDDLSLHIAPGEIYGFIGHNGAGKTTVFNMLTGVYKPTEGNIILKKDTTQVRVVSEETATVLNRLLQTVVTQGTGARANMKNETGITTAGKTGSSTGVKYVNGVQVDIENTDL